MDEIITKRLHISGLTPALTASDLSKRLSTFGTVKAVDGFGLQDGVGQPRKFGYVTLETTIGKLARCLNLLSGSTWKGAKLRIGEAKPDFAARLAAEREATASEPPKKRRKRCAGAEAADMSLVTPENVAGRGGWTVTPLGRVVRRVRMRPERPLPPPTEKEKRVVKEKDGKKTEKKKKRVKEPDVRARRRTIDVTRYGSVHLKGMFLEMEVLGTRRDEEPVPEVEMALVSEESESESGEDEVEEPTPALEEAPPSPKSVPSIPAPSLSTKTNIPPPQYLPAGNIDIAVEKTTSLNLLASLFGNKDDTDWIGRESVGSDVDEAEIAKRHRMVLDEDDDGDFEVVPMKVDVAPEQSDGEDEEDAEEVERAMETCSPPAKKKASGFSLMDHLDLDLELDDDVPFATTEVEASAQPATHTPFFSLSSTATPSYAAPQLNSKLPLFFPLGPSSGLGARPKDVFDVARENKWHWRDPNVGFYRTGTEEDIRKRWEESKVELTREWKRRCREAGKVQRRRRGGEGEGE
ncbi:hypothetical protein D9615_006634 [Tricholomella constricta]|uniref:RRM domain-containing protein n=1 Tax=Tricholomella constricta TaxID=117010 RepID=A0A8H5HAJ1_9AGAR|nr:hypothetical protein D9615_006634 [Tricholomella constricta]